jgi:ABC-type sugar transport system ATPase subunit
MGDVPVVRGRGLRKTYGGVEALRGVDFEIASGEIVGFAGDNGAGKSTLMKITSGAVRPTEGELELGGSLVEEFSPSHARRCGVEMVYQDLALCDNLDVRENIFLGRERRRRGRLGLRSLAHRDMADQAEQLLRRLDIELDSVLEPVVNLSGGQRQAVAISRTLAFQPKLIVMDEPTAALSVSASRPLIELIRRLPREGVAVMLVSHRLNDLLTGTDRIYVLRNGEVVANLRTGDTDEEQLLRLMAGLDAAASTTDRAG